jgi:hypothetical protein
MFHTCKYCGRDYKEKFNHDRHAQTCEFLSKTRREQDNEIDSFEKLPTPKEMFLLIQELSIRIEKIEKENTELKNIITHKIRKNFTDFLNQINPPDFAFDEFITMMVNDVEKYLPIVYEKDLLKANIELFNYFVEKYNDKLPIRAFDIKQNIFYIYDSENRWSVISNQEFDKILARISYRFLVEFNRCWYLVNKDKLQDDNYKEMYFDYYRKILGGERISDESRYQRIRAHIYNKIKKNIKSQCID